MTRELAGQEGVAAPVDVIYIGGYGRSGSTLLDQLLATELGVLSGGEMCNLFAWAEDGRQCTCGRQVSECEVWGPCLEDARSETGKSFRELEDVTRLAESGALPQDCWQRAWSPVYACLARQGHRWVIDSSKSSGRRDRVRLIEQSDRAQVALFIHLYRYLPAVLNSRRRGDNRRLEHGSGAGNKMFASGKGSVGWWLANAMARRQASRLNNTVALSYETLAADPRTAVRDLASATRSGVAEEAAPESLLHTVAGNRMARGDTLSRIRPDDAWRSDLPLPYKTWGASVNALARVAGILPGERAGFSDRLEDRYDAGAFRAPGHHPP